MTVKVIYIHVFWCHTVFMSYSAISIIYNPNSTGDSAKNAKQIQSDLKKRYPKLPVDLVKTEYAGHAEKLAYELALQSKNPLILSSSGDGGYNEVINGALKAQHEGAAPICAVIASGNANDHSRTLHNDDLIASITNENTHPIDVLKLVIEHTSGTTERYAHSYIGLGLTPVVAVELNKTDLNALKELWIVLRTFYKYRPFKIKHNGKVLRLDSIVFANIGEMAKVLTISKYSKPDDGLFEVVSFQHRPKRNLLKKLIKATVTGLEAPIQTKKYDLEVVKKLPAQLDGEVIEIKAHSTVTITSEHKILKTIV